MRSAALPGGSDDYYPPMRRAEREDCRLDLDKVTEGQMTADAFIGKWGAILRTVLIQTPETTRR